MEVIRLNVGGFRVILARENILKFHNSLLAKLIKCENKLEQGTFYDLYLEDTKEYFFNRSGFMFELVIAPIYRSPIKRQLKLFYPFWDDDVINSELLYWGLLESDTVEVVEQNIIEPQKDTERSIACEEQPSISSESLSSKPDIPRKTVSFETSEAPNGYNIHSAFEVMDANVSPDRETSIERFTTSFRKRSSIRDIVTTRLPFLRKDDHFHVRDLCECQEEYCYICKHNYTFRSHKKFRRLVWDFVENDTSVTATLYAVVNILAVCITIIILILDSLPQFTGEHCFDTNRCFTSRHISVFIRDPNCVPVFDDQLNDTNCRLTLTSFQIVEAVECVKETVSEYHWILAQKVTQRDGNAAFVLVQGKQFEQLTDLNGTNSTFGLIPEIHNDSSIQTCLELSESASLILFYLDLSSVIWFTVDYLIRVTSVPKTFKFIISPLSIIDILSIIPFYILLALEKTQTSKSKGLVNTVRKAILIQRILRLLRLLKIARYSLGIRVIGRTLQRSLKELGYLLTCMVVLITFFATIVFYLEHEEENTTFTSIPASAWWALITFTTVGYGDMCPKTIGGKLVASVATICSMLLIGFPVSVIVDNFHRTYDEVAMTTKRRSVRNWRRLTLRLAGFHDLKLGPQRKQNAIQSKLRSLSLSHPIQVHKVEEFCKSKWPKKVNQTVHPSNPVIRRF